MELRLAVATLDFIVWMLNPIPADSRHMLSWGLVRLWWHSVSMAGLHSLVTR